MGPSHSRTNLRRYETSLRPRKPGGNCPSFKPIMSVVKTPTYNPAKFLAPFLEPITTSIYNVKNSFEFATEIADQDPVFFTASLDVRSLFTNIPLEKTINVCCDSLFSNDVKVTFNSSSVKLIFQFRRKCL